MDTEHNGFMSLIPGSDDDALRRLKDGRSVASSVAGVAQDWAAAAQAAGIATTIDGENWHQLTRWFIVRPVGKVEVKA